MKPRRQEGGRFEDASNVERLLAVKEQHAEKSASMLDGLRQ
jgi:hypothetical protein